MGVEEPGGAAGFAFAISTFNRPQAIVRLVHSIREHFGAAPVYVADQSEPDAGLAAFCESLDVTYIDLPFDCGVSHARNVLVGRISEPFFVLCDDDFIMRPDTRFDGALAILDAFPEIGVVGGRLWDHHDGAPHHRSWELFMQYDRRNRMLLNVPIQQLRPREAHLGGRRYFQCDAVMNFAVMRRSIFDAGAGWDPRYTCNGEHEDFYLNLKENTPFSVVYLPEMVADHDHLPGLDYGWLRNRSDGWHLFLEKWDIDQLWESGMGFRCRAAPDRWTNAEQADARFLQTIAGQPQALEHRGPGVLALRGDRPPVPAYAYTGVGEPLFADIPATGDAVICGDGQMLPLPTPGIQTKTPASIDPRLLDPDTLAVTMLHRQQVPAGGVTAVWLHIAPRRDAAPLPDGFRLPLSFRWRLGRDYLCWDRNPFPFARPSGPGQGAWGVTTVAVPRVSPLSASGLALELWAANPEAPPLLIGHPQVISSATSIGSAGPFVEVGAALPDVAVYPCNELTDETTDASFRAMLGGAAA